jgi:hypothetical protein
MNLLAVTNFPSPRYPTAVVWFRDTLCRIRDLGHRVTVLSQRIWVPWPLGYVPRYAQYLKEVYYEEQNGLPVYRPVYPRPPGAWFVA